jgi:hypothetical protein
MRRVRRGAEHAFELVRMDADLPRTEGLETMWPIAVAK